ncbi:MAG: hypothetical protein R2856_12575 [Caldilineaceae bacterium]
MQPYASGEFVTPFVGSERQLGGASFDPATGRLYITAQKADREQGEYANPPVVMVYKIGVERHVRRFCRFWSGENIEHFT